MLCVVLFCGCATTKVELHVHVWYFYPLVMVADTDLKIEKNGLDKPDQN